MSYLYDAVIMYAKALDAVLRKNGSINDGRAVVKEMLNARYESAPAHRMSCANAFLCRHAGLHHVDGQQRRLAGQLHLAVAAAAQRPEAQVRHDAHGALCRPRRATAGQLRVLAPSVPSCSTRWIQAMQLVDKLHIQWDTPDRLPPKDTPKCGFDGMLCAREGEHTQSHSGPRVAIDKQYSRLHNRNSNKCCWRHGARRELCDIFVVQVHANERSIMLCYARVFSEIGNTSRRLQASYGKSIHDRSNFDHVPG